MSNLTEKQMEEVLILQAKKEERERIIKIISELKNPYPPDIFKWDNKEKVDLERGRFNKFTYDIVENAREKIIEEIEEE